MLRPEDFIIDYTLTLSPKNTIVIYDRTNKKYNLRVSNTGIITEVNDWYDFLNWIMLSVLVAIFVGFLCAYLDK
jgi:hypothetical protein